MINVALNPSDEVEKALNLYGNDILRLAYSYLKRREDAEDIVQETLIRFMQCTVVFEDESKVKAWLLQVAANLCKDELRSAHYKKDVAIPEGFDVADKKTEEKFPLESELMRAMLSLPEKYRSVIHLFYFEEYSTKEIAQILEKKEVTVRSLLKRGRDKLEKSMKGERSYAG